MFSSEGEKVEMSTSISTSAARGAVEKWLLQVQDTMIVSIKDVTAKARDVSTQYSSVVQCRGSCDPPYRHMLWTLVLSG